MTHETQTEHTMTPETPTFDYGEPWHTDSARGVMSKTGGVICYPFGFVAPERKLADRITACVNACYGMADPAAKIEAMRAAIREAHKIIEVLYMDALDNHKESWPRANEWLQKHADFANYQPTTTEP